MTDLQREDLDFTFPKFTRVSDTIFSRTQKRYRFTPEVESALTLVLISLKAYFEAPNPVLPFFELKLWATSFDGSAFLKKIRKKSIVIYLNGIMYDYPSWWNDIPSYAINEIGDIFNYQYCFPWEAVDENDYLCANLPLEKLTFKAFRREAKRLCSQLSDHETLKEREILLNLSSSVCLDSKNKKNLHYLDKANSLNFSSVRSEGKRCFVTTAPADGRDAIINKIEDLNTIQYIDQQLDIILRKDFTSIFLVDKNEEIFQAKLEKFIDDNNFFLMRDIKKEGITKPKKLLKIMLEALHERFPEMPAFQNTNFYSGPWFEGDKGKRGHGLGMANNLTTLMQIILFRILQDKVSKTGIDVTLEMITHNDDIIIGVVCPSIDEAEDVLNLDCIVAEKSGIIISRDKSFFSNIGGIICERYINKSVGLHKKISYRNREILLIYTAVNVCHAKSILSSVYAKFETEINIKEIISYFGYEFAPKEIELPISIGGWLRDKAFRCSFEIKYLEEHWSQLVYRIYLASRVNKISVRNKKKVKEFMPPLIKMFPTTLWNDVPDDVKEGLCVLTDRQARDKFTRIKKFPTQRLAAWKDLQKRRLKVFLQVPPNIPRSLLFKIIMEKNSNVFPPEEFIDRWVDIKIIRETTRDFCCLSNPVSHALQKIGIIDEPDISPCFWPIRARTHDNINKASERKALSRVINFVPPIYFFDEKDTVLPKDPEDFKDFWLSYSAPLLMGKVAEVYGKIPILKKEFFKDKDIISFDLTEENFLLYQKIPTKHFEFFMELKKSKDIEYWYCLEMIDKVFNVERKKVIVNKDHDYTSEEDRVFDADELLSDIIPKTLSWEESWDMATSVEDRGPMMFEAFYFKLDPDMRPILDLIKDIYLDREVMKITTDEEFASQLREKEESFREANPEFADVFEIFVIPAKNSDDEDSGEGMFGDFDIS